jgi:hypothetical protein
MLAFDCLGHISDSWLTEVVFYHESSFSILLPCVRPPYLLGQAERSNPPLHSPPTEHEDYYRQLDVCVQIVAKWLVLTVNMFAICFSTGEKCRAPD